MRYFLTYYEYLQMKSVRYNNKSEKVYIIKKNYLNFYFVRLRYKSYMRERRFTAELKDTNRPRVSRLNV